MLKRTNPRTPTTLPPTRLTRRNRQVLALVGEGLSTNDIAARLGLSPKTVEQHRSLLCIRLGISGPLCLVRFAASTKAAILLSQP